MAPDIRWHQRLQNLTSAFIELEEAIELMRSRELSKLEEQGVIQAFEYTYELSWNTIKDFYQSQGESDIQGSRDAIRLAFRRKLINNGEEWMAMIKSRTLTSHTYNRETAKKVIHQIESSYYQEIKQLVTSLQHRKLNETNDQD